MCYNEIVETEDVGYNYYERSSTMENYDSKDIKIGEIYMMHFSGSGNEQKGLRPGLVFQNNTGNKHSPNIIALPLTSSIKKPNQPTHVVIRASERGLLRDSMVLCENPERVSKENIGHYIMTVDDSIMSEVAVASLLSSSALSYVDPSILTVIWEKAVRLNNIKSSVTKGVSHV